MFFCTVCCPQVPLALKLEGKNSFLTLECENIHKAISDLSAKIENFCSRIAKEHQKNYNYIVFNASIQCCVKFFLFYGCRHS